MRELPKTPEWRDVTREKFLAEIAPLRKPAVLRGVAAHWPAVREGRRSPEAVCDYIRGFDIGKPVAAYVGAPSIKGRFWYQDDMSGVNYRNREGRLSSLLDAILAQRDNPEPPSLYAGSVAISEFIPGFARENSLDLPGEGAVPRIWIGNTVTVATHFDLSENIAIVVAGRRRFTMLPPEQVSNLYVGPFDQTFAGPPVSMVNLRDPDLARYPRFAEALEHAQSAELEPGDAVYIPYMWWHHVDSLERFNVLVNYWWELINKKWQGSPFNALIHAIMSIRDLPERERDIWRAYFEHYVFGDGHDAVAHLTPEARSILGEMTPQTAQRIKAWLINGLS